MIITDFLQSITPCSIYYMVSGNKDDTYYIVRIYVGKNMNDFQRILYAGKVDKVTLTDYEKYSQLRSEIFKIVIKNLITYLRIVENDYQDQ